MKVLFIRYSLLFILLLSVLVVMLLEGLDFCYLLLLLSCIILPALSLVLFILYKLKIISSKFYVGTLSLFFMGIMAFLISEPIRDMKNDQSIKEGDKIISALNSFKVDSNKYPKRLTELIPKYLVEIPRPRTGVFIKDDFFYIFNSYTNYGRYSLGFRCVYIDHGGQYIYKSLDGYDYWRYDD